MNGDTVINNIYTNNYSYEAKRLQQQIQYHTDLSQTIRWKFFPRNGNFFRRMETFASSENKISLL